MRLRVLIRLWGARTWVNVPPCRPQVAPPKAMSAGYMQPTDALEGQSPREGVSRAVAEAVTGGSNSGREANRLQSRSGSKPGLRPNLPSPRDALERRGASGGGGGGVGPQPSLTQHRRVS